MIYSMTTADVTDESLARISLIYSLPGKYHLVPDDEPVGLTDRIAAAVEQRCREALPGLRIVQAGVGRGHPLPACSHCGHVFEPEDESIATCTHTAYVTLCRPCYNAAGNRVR